MKRAPWIMRFVGQIAAFYVLMEHVHLSFWWALLLIAGLDCMYMVYE